MSSQEKFTAEELDKLKEAVTLLEKYKYSDVFGDISGTLQKLLDFIEIHSSMGFGEKYDFINWRKKVIIWK